MAPEPKGSAARHPVRDAILTWILERLAARLGRRSWTQAQRFGRRLGRLGWRLAGRDRRRTLEHLALAFPELDAAARGGLGKRCFEHYGLMLGEALHLLSADCEEVGRRVEMTGWEHVEAARRAGRPLLIATGHCGNWELLAAAINCRGLGMRVVARELEHTGFQSLLLGLRRRFGTETIERGSAGAARQLLAALRSGSLGMLLDQDTQVEGVWVPFFGRSAYTPVAAAKIARRREIAVLPTFIERLADGSHRAAVHAPLELPTDATDATAELTRLIEEQIRRVPEQWVWMHRRWRRQPEGRDES